LHESNQPKPSRWRFFAKTQSDIFLEGVPFADSADADELSHYSYV